MNIRKETCAPVCAWIEDAVSTLGNRLKLAVSINTQVLRIMPNYKEQQRLQRSFHINS